MLSAMPLFLAMIAAIILLKMLADKLRIAYPILIVVAGLLISFIPGLPIVHVNPNLIFFIFLPPLLFEASWSISFKEMKKWWRMIGSFAFLVVLFSAFSVAVAANYFIPGCSLALGFLLGGIVSPPDAVSAGAITKFVKIPRSTATILEGESLLNDASSLIIFRFAMAAVATGQFIWQDAALQFTWMVAGGVGIGLLIAFVLVQAHKRLPMDTPSHIALTLIGPYLMYWLAEEAHSSGVLAVVSGGLFMSNRRLLFLNSSSRIKSYSVWESLVFMLNGGVFMIIGLELPEIVEGLRAKGVSLRTAIGYSLIVTGVLIVARIISSYVALFATLLFRPGMAPHVDSRRRRLLMPLLLGWTGMRGVVSLAAALAIPVTLVDGSDFPYRNLILFITFVVILLTLVVQGLTLPYLIKRSGLFNYYSQEVEDNDAEKVKQGLRQHTIGFLRNRFEQEMGDQKSVEALLQRWEEKLSASNDDGANEKAKAVFLEMLESQREYLAGLNKDKSIDEEAIRTQLYLIDLEEERIRTQ